MSVTGGVTEGTSLDVSGGVAATLVTSAVFSATKSVVCYVDNNNDGQCYGVTISGDGFTLTKACVNALRQPGYVICLDM